MRKQSQGLTKEYDRLLEEHARLQVSNTPLYISPISGQLPQSPWEETKEEGQGPRVPDASVPFGTGHMGLGFSAECLVPARPSEGCSGRAFRLYPPVAQVLCFCPCRQQLMDPQTRRWNEAWCHSALHCTAPKSPLCSCLWPTPASGAVFGLSSLSSLHV